MRKLGPSVMLCARFFSVLGISVSVKGSKEIIDSSVVGFEADMSNSSTLLHSTYKPNIAFIMEKDMHFRNFIHLFNGSIKIQILAKKIFF